MYNNVKLQMSIINIKCIDSFISKLPNNLRRIYLIVVAPSTEIMRMIVMLELQPL